MTGWVFALTLLGEGLLIGALLLTLLRPGFRAWPPPGRRSWQFVFTWSLLDLVTLGLLLLGWLDRGSLELDHGLR